MLRYYVAATFIVLTLAVGVTAWNARELLRIRIASTSLPAPPKPQTSSRQTAGGEAPMRGDAPWALSALPDCLRQKSEATGSVAFASSKIPPGARRIAPGSRLVYGPCTISVGNGEAFVSRGPDRLRIPPVATLYRAGDKLFLLRRTGRYGELRVYTAAPNL